MKKRIQESLKRLQAEGKVVTITRPLVFRRRARIKGICLKSQTVIIENGEGHKKQLRLGKDVKLQSRSGRPIVLEDFQVGDVVKLLYTKDKVRKMVLSKEQHCHLTNLELGSQDSRIRRLVSIKNGKTLTVNRDSLNEFLKKKKIQYKEREGWIFASDFSKNGKPLSIGDLLEIEEELGLIKKNSYPQVLFVTNRLQIPDYLAK